MRKPIITVLALLLALGTVLAACGDDDGADVRASGEASGSGSGGSGSGNSSGSGSGVATCTPVGSELIDEADETVDIDLLDFAFDPPDIEVATGVVTFRATNEGENDHELAVLPGGGEVPFIEPGVPDEEARADAGAFELEGFPAGTTCDATWELAAGEYTLFCIVPADDGETHYEKGMAGTLTVT
jgi:plastocyanin